VLLVDDDVDSPIDGPKLASLPFLEGDSPETDGRFFSLDDPRPPVENFFWSHEDFFSLPVGSAGREGIRSRWRKPMRGRGSRRWRRESRPSAAAADEEGGEG
jgi:hypothetical protein